MSVLVALLVLAGLGAMLWAVESRLVWGPTPTPTATRRPPATPTPDFRATNLAQDLLTQVAYEAALAGTRPATSPVATATPTTVQLMIPVISSDGATPTLSPTATLPLPENSPTPANQVILPVISNESGGIVATATPPPSPVETPTPPPEEPTWTPTPTPTPELPTPTPAIVEPTATPTPSPTPVPFTVASLPARVRSQDTSLRIGPSNIYTVTGTLVANQEIRLLGRSPSGEWVYVCCVANNEPGWVRQAYVDIPADADLGPGAPEDADVQDVRWLNVQPAPSFLYPLPTPTAIPENDFPRWRYDAHATGLLPRVPNPPVSFAWPVLAQAAQTLSSPVLVSGSSVMVASNDHHLYSFDRINGNQRWRFNLGQAVASVAPAIHQGVIYVADSLGQLRMLEDQGNQAREINQYPLPAPPVTGINIISDTLLVGVGQESSWRLFALDLRNLNRTYAHEVAGAPPQYPTVGDQLVYLGANTIQALDISDFEVVWTQPAVASVTAPPVYHRPGVRRLAELYVADANNVVRSLDANTGDELWNRALGQPITGLAVSPVAVYAAGNGYVVALSRLDGAELWRNNVAGAVLGGPLVGQDMVITVTQGGEVQYFNATTGSPIHSAIVASTVSNAPAISGAWIFIPGTDGGLYALRGNG